MRKHRWVWVLLFILIVGLLVVLATGWNVVLVRDYQRIVELARGELSRGGELSPWPWLQIVLGTLGFAAVVTGLALFFARLLKEMRLNQLQSEFLATVSHELKTPLSTMELCSSLLQSEGISEEERRRLWASHDAELKRLKEEVDALLDAARLESSTGFIRTVPVQLESWISDSLARWEKILGPSARLERVGEPLNCEARVDPKILNLIADNLLDNARKFSQGPPSVTVDSHVERDGDGKVRWQLRIRDQGLGFDPTEARRIFKRFYRARTGARQAIPGTGLGLYLAAAASKAMGLRLRGESEGVGKGAVFTLEGRGR